MKFYILNIFMAFVIKAINIFMFMFCSNITLEQMFQVKIYHILYFPAFIQNHEIVVKQGLVKVGGLCGIFFNI